MILEKRKEDIIYLVKVYSSEWGVNSPCMRMRGIEASNDSRQSTSTPNPLNCPREIDIRKLKCAAWHALSVHKSKEAYP